MAQKNEPLLQKIPSPMQKEGISHQIEQLSQPTNGKTLNTGKNCHLCAQIKKNTRCSYFIIIIVSRQIIFLLKKIHT